MCAVAVVGIVMIIVSIVADETCSKCCCITKCTNVAANVANVEDFGKVIVEVWRKTHYNRECPNDRTLSVYVINLK